MMRDFLLRLRIFLPLALLLALGAFPAPRAVGEGLWLARQDENAGRYKAAALKLRTVLAREPHRLQLLERIGRDELAAGDLGAAASALRQAQKASQLSLDGLVQLALTLELREEWIEAARLRQELAARAGSAPGDYAYAVADYRHAGALAEAAAAARAWQRAWPGQADAAYTSALFLVSEDMQQAESAMEDCARADPACQAAWEDLRRAVGQAGLSSDAGYRATLAGRWLSGLGEWDLAEQAFARAAELSPGYAEAWAFWGQARVQNGKDGLGQMEKALLLNPDSVLAHALLGIYWTSAASYDRAIEQFAVAAKLEPERAIWLVEIGNLTALNGDLIAARGFYAAAQALDPEDPAVWEAMARFSLVYGDDLRGYGLPAARRLVELRPNQAASLDVLGAMILELGDPRGAERILQQALLLDGRNPAAHLHLGQVYLQLRQNQSALVHLKRALELDGQGAVGQMAARLLDRYFRGG